MKWRRWTLVGILAAGLAALLAAAWDSMLRPRFRAVAPGVEFARFRASPFRFHTFASVAAVRVDPSRATLRVMRPASGRATVRELVEQFGALGGTNGTYFDEHGRVLGMTISDGRVLTPLRQADWGVFYIDGAGPHLEHTEQFSARGGIRFAVQCGPRLVVDAVPVKLKEQSSHRTAIGLDPEGRVVLAVSAGQPFRAAKFARLLAAPRAKGGLGCRAALNLDGGRSTQMYLKTGDVLCDIPGLDKVANAVGVFAVAPREPH